MQILVYLKPYLSFVKKYRYQCVAALCASVLVLGVACWFYTPGTQVAGRQAYKYAASYLGLRKTSNDIATDLPSTAPNPTPDPVKEHLAELERRLAEVEVGQIDQKTTVSEVEGQLKAAIAEVAKTNDILDKRQTEWLATLKRVSVATGISTAPSPSRTPSSSAEPNSPTQSGSMVTKDTATPSLSTSSKSSTSAKVNINLATLEQLDALPGIGLTYAQRILDYRTQKGVFTKVEDIQNVSGIGPSIFSKIQGLITV